MTRPKIGGLALVAALTCVAEASQSLVDSPRWLIAPPGVKPAFSVTTSARDLQRRFGSGSLRFDRIPDGEHGDRAGAILFPTDPLRRIELIWHDPERTELERAQLRGDKTEWKVAPGITLGTPLSELQRLNQKPITFLGLGWDGSGLIRYWGGGRLQSFDDDAYPRVSVRLSQAVGTPNVEASRGDRLLTSDMPELAALKLFVSEIRVVY